MDFILPAIFLSVASAAHIPAERGNYGVKARPVPAPTAEELRAQDWPAKPATAESKGERRKLAGGKSVGDENMMSAEHKKFRDEWTKTRDPDKLEALLVDYDRRYESLPNDLKYVVARLSPLIPFRGFFWRMATLAHQAVVTQEMLLATVRAFAEQMMILEPDTHWKALMGYFSIPTAALVAQPPAIGDDVDRPDRRFYVENDFTRFLAVEVYPVLAKTTSRLSKLQTTVSIDGKEVPIVLDNRIRFGDQAFGDAYDAADRFAIIGEAERLLAVARFHRRMCTIGQLVAYNLNGNISLRKEIGRKYGIDASLSSTKDRFFGGEALSIEGLTREDRIEIARKHPNLFALLDKEWMRVSYSHLNRWVEYSAQAWEIMRGDRDGADLLLDPDLFAGRRDQIDRGFANLRALVPPEDSAKATVIQGAISGDTLRVNLRDFFHEPPQNLKQLMPTGFQEHEDIAELAKKPGAKLVFQADKSAVKMTFAGTNQKTLWRNYLYGRAVAWDVAAFSRLFPDLKNGSEVARAQRILAETRGARPLLSTLQFFVK